MIQGDANDTLGSYVACHKARGIRGRVITIFLCTSPHVTQRLFIYIKTPDGRLQTLSFGCEKSAVKFIAFCIHYVAAQYSRCGGKVTVIRNRAYIGIYIKNQLNIRKSKNIGCICFIEVICLFMCCKCTYIW